MIENCSDLHVAVIMDGNGRWATARGLERLVGHKRGVDRVDEIVSACPDLGIKHLTLFAFSTENWKRSAAEVSGLMTLFRRYIRSESARLKREGVRVRFIGRRHELDQRLQDLMAGLEDLTADNDLLHLTVAINYGGRDEIVRAARKAAELVQSGEIPIEDIDEHIISTCMDTADITDPDLVIRTSGEYRTSNFLPWQSVYAEYDFPKTAWPDFTPDHLRDTLDGFRNRERRFGAVLVK